MKTQASFFGKQEIAYGGDLQKKRKGRTGPRPITSKDSMHIVMRSSQARGEWSFIRAHNKTRVQRILEHFAKKYGVKIISIAMPGNHIHAHVKFTKCFLYRPFIRAVTSAIAMAVTKASRTKKLKQKFWDRRPFTRVIRSFKEYRNLTKYVRVNQLEAQGFPRETAEIIAKEEFRSG